MGFDQEGITPYAEKISPSDGSRTQSIRVCVHAHLHQDTDHRLGKSLDTRQNFSQNDHFDNCTSQINYSQINSSLLQTLATTTSTTTPPSRTKSLYEIELRNLSYRRTTTSPSKKISTYFGVTKNSSEDSPASSSSSVSKYILKRVNMRARPGEILGVAGPSGAGKSTLLEILAGRLQPSKCSTILVNSQPMDAARLRRISGYVMQEDALFPLLTVQETLMYSARLRLPASVSLAEKTRRVEAIMQELGLMHVASSRVGDVENVRKRGVSGGERRRVSIGVDVIHDPAILILDEPTSGLDSSSALHVVEMLSRMAVLRHRTIVLSIHQPSYRILELLPSVLLLAGGRVVHHGAVQILATRLAGHTIPEQVNVLEYAIDMLDESRNVENNSGSGQKLFETAESGATLTLECTFDLENASPLSAGADQCDKTSHNNQRDHQSRHQIAESHHIVTFANSNWQEILVLAHRTWRNVLRTNQLFRARTLHSLAAGLSLGSVYFHMGYGSRGASERFGLLAFTVTLLLTSTIEVLPTFLEELRILTRETSRGAYRMSSYVLSNTLIFLPFLFLNAILFSTPLYWMTELAMDFSAFLFFLLVVWLLLVTAYSFVAFASALVPSYQLGYTLVMGSMGCSFLFSGFFISKENLPSFWRFMHYISLYKYPLEALLINEYVQVGDKCFGTILFDECSLTGRELLAQGGYSGHGGYGKWINVGVMAGFAVFYRILCFLVLQFKLGRCC